MGIGAYILRTGHLSKDQPNTMTFRDCTNNGWSNNYDEVVVVNAEGPFDPTPDRPGVLLVPHRSVISIHAVLVEHAEDNGVWTMAGGNFLTSSDSRFGELCKRLIIEAGMQPTSRHFGYGAVSIHDRIEP